MPSLHIDEIHPKRDLCPYIVNFQNGYPAENFRSEDCLVFTDEKTDAITVAAEAGRTLYTGVESEEPLGRTLVLARSKKTGKVRLIEVGTVELKALVINDIDVPQILDNSTLELGRKFGSKKHKKQLEQNEKLKQNEQAVVAQMANVSQNLTQEQLDLSIDTPTDADNFYTPPINRNATSVTEVYDIDTILTPEQFESISNEISSIENELMDKLNPIINTLVKNELTLKQKILALYASCLFNIYFLKFSDFLKKSFIACYESLTLNEHIIKNFFTVVNKRRCRPIQYRDKAMIHAMVLLLLINNYKFNFEEFCHLTKTALKTSQTKFAMTGGSVVVAHGVRVGQLKLPLNKPPSRRKSMK